jgi:hypothetical protein
MKVTVHHFRVWNPTTDDYIMPRRKSPADRIKNDCNGEIIEGTAEDVDASSLDEHGRYDPAWTDTKPS